MRSILARTSVSEVAVGANDSDKNTRRLGQSRIRNFLQAIELIPDCGGAPKGRSLPYDLRPLDPRSTRFARHLPLRFPLRAPKHNTTTDTHKSEFSYKSSGTFPTDGGRLSGDAGSMTYARKILIPKGSPGTFHCVSRCVRRAFLCGEDRLTGRSFEHRRQWVEDRIHELAGIFGIAIWGYAVMSNHLHVVVQILPEEVALWSKQEVVKRWMRLYPRQDQNPEMRAEVLAGNAEHIEVLRERLSNL